VGSYLLPAETDALPLGLRCPAQSSVDLPVFVTKLMRAGEPLAERVREVALLPRVDSPALAGLVELGECAGALFAVEMADRGVELATVLDAVHSGRIALSSDLCVFIALGLCEGVDALHVAGLSHLRVEPGHVRIRADGQPILLGGVFSSLLAPSQQQLLFLPREVGLGRGDARSDACSVAELARTLGTSPAGAVLAPAVLAVLVRAGAGGAPARCSASELAGALRAHLGEGAPGRCLEKLASLVARLGSSRSLDPGDVRSRMDVTPFGLAQRDEELAWTAPERALALDGHLDGAAPAPGSNAGGAGGHLRPSDEPPLELDEAALAHLHAAAPVGSAEERVFVDLPRSPEKVSRIRPGPLGLGLAIGAAGVLWLLHVTGNLTTVKREIGEVFGRSRRMLDVHGLEPKPSLIRPADLGIPTDKTGPTRLQIESVPSGAQVFLGDMLLGITPVNVDNDFTPGVHSYRIELEGYAPYQDQFVGRRTARIVAQLRPR
jgi:hypothetical protein